MIRVILPGTEIKLSNGFPGRIREVVIKRGNQIEYLVAFWKMDDYKEMYFPEEEVNSPDAIKQKIGFLTKQPLNVNHIQQVDN